MARRGSKDEDQVLDESMVSITGLSFGRCSHSFQVLGLTNNSTVQDEEFFSSDEEGDDLMGSENTGPTSLDFSHRNIAKITAFKRMTFADVFGGGTKPQDLYPTALPPPTTTLYTSLVKLNLSYNRLPTLQDILSLTSLRSLDASFNLLTEVPERIDALTSLQELSLHANSISSLGNIDKLEKLRILNIGKSMCSFELVSVLLDRKKRVLRTA